MVISLRVTSFFLKKGREKYFLSLLNRGEKRLCLDLSNDDDNNNDDDDNDNDHASYHCILHHREPIMVR